VCFDLVFKGAEPAFNVQLLRVASLRITHNPCINTKRPADFYQRCGSGLVGINFHSVTHIENLVHFFPAGAGGLLYQAKQRRRVEEIVFDYSHFICKMKHLGLGASAAMDDCTDFWAVVVRSMVSGWGHRCALEQARVFQHQHHPRRWDQ